MAVQPTQPAGPAPRPPELSEEQRMLILLRDELYEGRWDLFVADLEARLSGEPHLFEIGPASPQLRETISGHLRLIEELRAADPK